MIWSKIGSDEQSDPSFDVDPMIGKKSKTKKMSERKKAACKKLNFQFGDFLGCGFRKQRTLQNYHSVCSDLIYLVLEPGGHPVLEGLLQRKFQHTPLTYPRPSAHLFMEDNLPYQGYVPGICWNFLRFL